MDFQFYPTPEKLRDVAWAKFENKSIRRLLEPSAGEGHLIKKSIEVVYVNKTYSNSIDMKKVDVMEINVQKHPILREMGVNVVGIDFMKAENLTQYSHIIANPPFANGVEHLLHAWDKMYDGEIVFILNAESVKNPYTINRKRMCAIIEEHGSVEYIQDGFIDAERETGVEVAVIHLIKKAEYAGEVVGNILDSLKNDEIEDVTESAFENNALAIPKNFIENQVVAFKASVIALKESLFANARYSHYASMLGRTLENYHTDQNNSVKGLSPKELQNEFGDKYSDLKNRAWTSILYSTEVVNKLSSLARKRFEAEFDVIKELEFNVENIYGFLIGLSQSQGEIQKEMVLDIFDKITKYHSDNIVFHMGWKSNDSHRIGMRIRKKRFIIPNNLSYGSMSFEAKEMLRDFDKVFSMLDGKPLNDEGLTYIVDGLYDAFTSEEKLKEMRNGGKVSTRYFDVRFYKVGTIHFYPKDEAIVDRLNRMVGAWRQWIPATVDETDSEFWKHYEKCEKTDKSVRESISKTVRHNHYIDPFWVLRNGREEDELLRKSLTDAIYNSINNEMLNMGIDVNKKVSTGQQQLLLNAA